MGRWPGGGRWRKWSVTYAEAKQEELSREDDGTWDKRQGGEDESVDVDIG